MDKLTVWRVGEDEPAIIGELSSGPRSFTYSASYLASENVHPISLSLPLQEESYDEEALLPYFDGLLPEGASRDAVAEAISIDPNDFMVLLLHCGMEIIGDVAITQGDTPRISGEYKQINNEEMKAMFADSPSIAQTVRASRLSLAGTQGKTGLAHIPNCSMDEGWYLPTGGYASSHVLKTSTLNDIPYLEFICMHAAKECGINVPSATLLDLGRPVFCIERFDREVSFSNGELDVIRLHQEDAAQAFGIRARQKYQELRPSTARAISEIIRENSDDPIADIEEFVKITCFNYLVGNCDNHLKNLSFLYGREWRGFRLAPVYDLVSTTRYDRFSRDMGMQIGSTRAIDDISTDDFFAFANEVGVNRSELQKICAQIAEMGHKAIYNSSDITPRFDAIPIVANDLIEEMGQREYLLRQIAE